MKTIGLILLLIWLPFYMSAQTGEQIEIDPVTLLPTGKFVKQPQQLQGLDKMSADADLVFKGQVVSSTRITNTAFQFSDMFVHATKFKIISILKGTVSSDFVVFQHYNEWSPGGHGGDGAGPPEPFKFENGQSYLIFAANMAKPGFYYSRPPATTNQPNEFRQLTENQNSIFHTLDPRSLPSLSISNAIWLELNLLLNDKDRTNQIYAIQHLNGMSVSCSGSWRNENDYTRESVLKAVLPFTTNGDERVAISAIGCFEVGGSYMEFVGESGGWPSLWMTIERGCSGVQPECIAQVLPFADNLAAVANSSPSSLCRVAAIAAFSCTQFSIVSNSLPRWLTDPAPEVRAQAVLLLPDFPGEFCERLLQERAADTSPVVRAAVADAIGNGKIETLLPALGTLFSTSPVRTNSDPWPHKGLQGDDYFAEVGADDIHTSAGYALLKFDVDQVGEILKTNISDKGFGLSFIRKLAPNGAEPYFPLLAKELKTHTADSEQEAAKNGFHWPLSYWLSGNYGWEWGTLFGYVSTQPREALANPKFTPMLDALQIADDPGDARTRSLYAFFLDKGLTERAIELRRGIIRRTEDKAIDKKSFNFPALLKAFDEMDKQHSLEPGLGL
jgi:hypothetical protein